MARARRPLLCSPPLRAVALLALAAIPLAAAADAPAPKVCLQPLGDYDERLLAPIARGLAQVYGFEVRQLSPRALPPAAWYEPRRRYRAARVLDHLRDEVWRAQRDCDFLVGFTAADISMTKGRHADWGVLGLSYRGEGVSVLSSFRMRGGGASGGKVIRRAVKIAAHELGHGIGLPHRNDGIECLMNDANGAVASIDRARGTLCPPEREAAEALLGRALPRRQLVDWTAIVRGN